MIPKSDYLDHIQRTFPNIELQDVQINEDGMVNVSVIVNKERVFRFPRADWGVDLLWNEANAIDLVCKYVEVPVPDWDYRSDEMISYPFIPGDALLTDDLLRMSEREKDAVATKLATLLKQMHSIPMAEVKAANIQQSDTVRTVDDWLQLYEEVQEHLFPLMWADGREWVRRHFAPLLADHSLMDHEPIFMNGDLAPYHLLFNRQTNHFSGIIDFGTAGVGDPAADFCTLINQYGESFLRRMSRTYPEIREHIDRARFRAGTLELQWLLRGLRDDMKDMLVVHIGRVRDVQPIGERVVMIGVHNLVKEYTVSRRQEGFAGAIRHLFSREYGTVRARIDAVIDAMKEMAAATQKEDGCIHYQFYQDINDPVLFLVFEKWESTAALEAHMDTPHMAVLRTQMPDLLGGPMDVQRFEAEAL